MIGKQCSRIAQELFAFGQAKAAEHGLVLVDTKYEMGRDENGEILLIDEIHTPDSSRYWIADSYQQHMREGQETRQRRQRIPPALVSGRTATPTRMRSYHQHRMTL